MFSSSEFPAEKAALDRMGIKYISVDYEFSGEGAVIAEGVAPSTPVFTLMVPRKILQCWKD
jgi:hypothetical protein